MQVAQQLLATLARDWDSGSARRRTISTGMLARSPQPHDTKPEDIMADHGPEGGPTMKTPPIVTPEEWVRDTLGAALLGPKRP